MPARLRKRSSSAIAGASAREAYRVLRSNLLVALDDAAQQTVIVTSAAEGEGKTATCAGLARSLAGAGHRVVVIDLDLRHPDIHRWLGGHNEVGVSNVLLDGHKLEGCLQLIVVGAGPRGADRSLYLLAAGTPVENPAELLGSQRVRQMLDVLCQQADVVLIDTPPILPVADTLVIGRIVGGAVLVVEARRTPVPTVRRAKDALIRNQTRLYGVVVNKLDRAYAEYGYGYGYEYGYGDENIAADAGEGTPAD